jgi:DNA-directed RNA polymerase specialized sigma24 family protein
MKKDLRPALDQGGDRAHVLPALVRRCSRGGNDACKILLATFTRVAGWVLAGFRNLSRLEREEAEDAARVKVFEKLTVDGLQADTDGAVVAFFRAAVYNSAIDVWRRRVPTGPWADVTDEAPGSPHHSAQQRAALECAEQVIHSWDPEDRFIFIMKLDGAPTATIKTDLERLFGLFITTGAVDVRFSRLRADVRERCGEERH